MFLLMTKWIFLASSIWTGGHEWGNGYAFGEDI